MFVLLQPVTQLPVSLILLQEDVDIEYQEAGCFSVKMGQGDLFGMRAAFIWKIGPFPAEKTNP
jgi:hypothetical protein